MSDGDEDVVLTASEVCLPTRQDDDILGEDNIPSCAEETESKKDTASPTEAVTGSGTGQQNGEDNKSQPEKKKRTYYDGSRIRVVDSDDDLEGQRISMSCRFDSDFDSADESICAHINAQSYSRELINQIIGVDATYGAEVEIATKKDLYRERTEISSDEVSTKGKENSESDTRTSATSEASTKSKTPKRKKRKVDPWFKKKRKSSSKDSGSRGSSRDSESGTTSPSIGETTVLMTRRKSRRKSPDSSLYQVKQPYIQSLCFDDSSDTGAIPDSTVAATEVLTQDLCHCQKDPSIYADAQRIAGEVYCQALDTMNNKIIGCCNTVQSRNLPMFRASERTCYQMLCPTHLQRLILHNSCPICGIYCTKGRFYMCKSMHHFHKMCVTVDENGMVMCPHCGDDNRPRAVILIMNALKEPILLPQQKAPKTVKAARMSITRGVEQILEDDRDPEFDFPPAVLAFVQAQRNSGGADLSDSNMLAHLLSIAYRSLPELPSNCNTRRCSYKAMYAALEAGDISKILRMIAAGLNPNHEFEDKNRRNPLHVAAKYGHSTLVHILLQAQTQINAMDTEQNTPLTLAIVARHNDIVKYLVKSGADLHMKGEDGMTPLHVAAKFGNVGACFHILNSPNLPYNYMDTLDDGGWTPLVWASEFNHIEVVRFLLGKGADSLVKDTEQNIALHWAAFGGSIDIVELFLNDGIDINTVNVHGDTPLHIAARQDKYNCVLLLLARGAKSCIKNLAGEYARECSESPECEIYKAITLNMEIHNLLGRYTRQDARILSNDISRGKERNQIQCVNDIDEELWPSDFVYVTQSCFTSRISVDRVITDMKYCECTDTCNALTCACGNISIKYDVNGRLQHDFNCSDPPIIFECNEACNCNRITCRNRVVQNGINCRFQLFKTETMGWGIKTLNPIPKGTFVCEYVGEIITDSEADHREDDSYLFDLDNKDGETFCIDARHYGNFARFINHLCVPNLMPVHVFTDHQDIRFPRIAFFSNRDIYPDEELGYNYGEKFWIIKCKSFTCTCGDEKCLYSDDAIEETLENYHRKSEDES